MIDSTARRTVTVRVPESPAVRHVGTFDGSTREGFGLMFGLRGRPDYVWVEPDGVDPRPERTRWSCYVAYFGHPANLTPAEEYAVAVAVQEHPDAARVAAYAAGYFNVATAAAEYAADKAAAEYRSAR